MDTLTRPTPTATTTTPPPRSGRWRRRLLAAAGIAVVVVVGLIARSNGGAHHDMAGPAELLPPDVRGVYALEDGHELTLTGTVDHVRTEIGDAVTFP
jgi:hypothetical protein